MNLPTSIYAGASSDCLGGGSHSFGGLFKCSVTNQVILGHPEINNNNNTISKNLFMIDAISNNETFLANLEEMLPGYYVHSADPERYTMLSKS